MERWGSYARVSERRHPGASVRFPLMWFDRFTTNGARETHSPTDQVLSRL